MGALHRENREDSMKYRTALTLDEFRGLEESEIGRRGRGGRGQVRREGRRHERQEDRRDGDRTRVAPPRRREEPPRRPMRERDPQNSRFPWATDVSQASAPPSSAPALEPNEAELIPVEEGTSYTYQPPPTVQEVELVPAVGATSPRRWSKPAKMGPNLKIQAQEGFRAAVIELKPGLYVVAEIAEQATRPEFGLAPMLAPLVVKAATNALLGPRDEGRQSHSPIQLVLQAPALPQLPPPSAVSESSETEVGWDPRRARPMRQALPAPAVGRWADPTDVAGAFGCDHNPRCGCRHVG